ncbi:nitrate- and nitrite sensing domain-containing protein [Allokutzneria sp. A3M-2-11 16]|uniref:sensor histidine kinase n=1 Tax=Allokutzneria sp. A3M-2-11 16 TaxID=2962043 RepID=UPI0020B79E91|nr:nitrate- and nitrite sensing domain-containing protein [Allokutzneria sp. A3M-2-11 16]MCP3798338.1 nitrate- and nitrite sensing domain-containing protein [Allokutzneria sp. A3M-2-11 16]
MTAPPSETHPAGTIRGRLLRILVLCLTVVVVVLGVEVFSVIGRDVAARATSDSVTTEITVQRLVHEVQRERGLSSVFLSGHYEFGQLFQEYRARTDAAQREVLQLLGRVPVDTAAAVRPMLDRLSDLPATRTKIDSKSIGFNASHDYFTERIASLNQGYLDFNLVNDRELQYGLFALRSLATAKERMGQQRSFLNGIFNSSGNRFRDDEYVTLLDIIANKQAAFAEFARQATPEQRQRLDRAQSTKIAADIARAQRIAVASGGGVLPERVNSRAHHDWTTAYIDELQGVLQSVADDIQQRADALQSDATTELVVVVLLVLLVVALLLWLFIDTNRSIIGPLAVLAEDAEDIATRRLPEAVAALQTAREHERPPPPEPMRAPAGAGAEIHSVTRALDRVQSTAFALANEQTVLRRNTSESMANLGRRNQNLLRRQLAFITDLEQEELDPAVLANLFQLDHLATRMRRNAESLLVLAGTTSPRQWTEPLPVVDVIRAALAEVEDYHRVVFRRIDDQLVAGAVAAEIAHMLAELIENGLSFSPPEVEVEIYGRRVPSGYALAVIDHGIGMTAEAIAKANSRLDGEENFLVAPTRFLGHYVVGQLAKRLGVQVGLAESPASGVTARIALPASLLVAGPATRTDADDEPELVRRAHAISAPPQPKPPAAAPAPAPVAVLEAEPAPDNVTQHQRPSGERTRNGLLKRVPRDQATSQNRSVRAVSKPPVADRTPAEVRSMLSDFRGGHKRGESAFRGSSEDQAGPHTVSHQNAEDPR